MRKESKDEIISYGWLMPHIGVLGGIAIALGVPYVVVRYGHDLGAGLQFLSMLLSISIGGGLAITSRSTPGRVTRVTSVRTLPPAADGASEEETESGHTSPDAQKR
jgi:hypothetical protein